MGFYAVHLYKTHQFFLFMHMSAQNICHKIFLMQKKDSLNVVIIWISEVKSI